MKAKTIGSGLATLAGNAGKGALAGVVATATMTASSTLEMKLRGREASSAPSDAAGRVLGVRPRDKEGQTRFSNLVHWGYGTAWGAIGGMIRTSVPEPAASLAHFASVWGTEVTMLPSLQIAPPLPKWGPKETAIDVMHHAIYAAAFAGVWYLLAQSQTTDRGVGAILRSLRAA